MENCYIFLSTIYAAFCFIPKHILSCSSGKRTDGKPSKELDMLQALNKYELIWGKEIDIFY